MILLASLMAMLAGVNGLPAAYASFTPQNWTVTTYDAQGIETEGGVTQNGSTTTLTTNGWNVWGAADGFTLVSQPVESLYGECSTVTISATLNSVDDIENVNAAAGLMFRGSQAADSKNVMLRMQNGSLLLTYRTEDGGSTAYKRGASLSFPVEMKLVRQGNAFTGYYKKDGAWVLSNYVNIDMGTTIEAGIAGYSAVANPITAEFQDIVIDGESNYTPPDGDYTDTEPVAADTLLRERFEDGSVSNEPEAVNNPVWRGVTSACINQDADGNRSWQRNGANGLAFAGDKTWTDYEVSMDVQFDPSGSGGNLAELLVRARDTKLYGNFYYAVGCMNGTELVLEKSFAGSASTLKKVSIDNVLDGEWHTIKAKVLDNTIEVYLDGQLMIQATDSTLPNLVGSVGIRTEDSKVKLDNLIVTKLDDPLGGDYDNEAGGDFDQPAPME